MIMMMINSNNNNNNNLSLSHGCHVSGCTAALGKSCPVTASMDIFMYFTAEMTKV